MLKSSRVCWKSRKQFSVMSPLTEKAENTCTYMIFSIASIQLYNNKIRYNENLPGTKPLLKSDS